MTTEPTIRVTARDMSLGDEGVKEIGSGQFVIVCAEPLHVAHEQRHKNGTVVIVLKPRGHQVVDMQEHITELAREAVDARLALTEAIRDACPKPHAFVQHRDHQPAWCETCGRGENGVVYKPGEDRQ